MVSSAGNLTSANNAGRKRGAKKEEELSVTEAMRAMYAGVTVGDMEILFRMDRRTILARLSGEVNPVGKRRGAELYLIRDVAPYLVKPAGDMEVFLKRARPQDLPPNLTKEYWNGQRAKQAFLLQEGHLWRTEKVVEVVSEAFRNVRAGLMLIPDRLATRTQLSDIQREEVTSLVDDIMKVLRESLIANFDGPDIRPEDEPGSAGAGILNPASDDASADEFIGEDDSDSGEDGGDGEDDFFDLPEDGDGGL